MRLISSRVFPNTSQTDPIYPCITKVSVIKFGSDQDTQERHAVLYPGILHTG